VIGALLDSVPAGPAINDNGSGTAVVLEIALQMAKLGIKPTNAVRFAFWGGEDDGLIGSTFYVSQLDARATKDHMLNLNLDMVGSPRSVEFVDQLPKTPSGKVQPYVLRKVAVASG
jgi:Zn-dependent M28 family amino/carboxypeptidase